MGGAIVRGLKRLRDGQETGGWRRSGTVGDDGISAEKGGSGGDGGAKLEEGNLPRTSNNRFIMCSLI
jgi:hypothetical protein